MPGRNLGALAGTLPNDTTGNPINISQYELWKQQFVAATPALLNRQVIVPELAALLLMALAVGLGQCGQVRVETHLEHKRQ